MARILLNDNSGHAFLMQLSRELAHRGHEVLHTFMAEMQAPRGDLQKSDRDPASLRIEPLSIGEAFPKYSYLKRLKHERAHGRLLASVVRREEPDVFIAANTSPGMLAPAAAVCRELNCGFIFWVQDLYGEAVTRLLRRRYFGFGRWVGRYFQRLERNLLASSQHVVVITGDFVPFMREAGVASERISVIHNWAPLPELPRLSQRNVWSERQNLQDYFVFLYSGTLGLKHNPEYLARLAEVFRGYPDVRVVVISEGLGADWLRQAKQQRQLDNLKLLPYQLFQELPQVLGTAQVLLALLEEDAGIFSVPSKVLSYMCAGRPILMAGPEANLAMRILQQENAGRVCRADDLAAFCGAAQTLYADAEARQRLGDNARCYAEKHFDIQMIGNRIEELIVKVSHEAQLQARR